MPRTKRAAKPEAGLVWLHIDNVALWDKNPRKNEAAIPVVEASLLRFGFVAPVCVWAERNRLVAGHTRLAATRAILAKNPERFEDDARNPPPFPSCTNYDAKAWHFITSRATPGALFWNVAR